MSICMPKIFQYVDINASDIDSDNMAHGYHADNPNFLSKTIVATLFIGAFFIILLLNPNILHFAFNPKRSILSRYKPS